MNMKKPRQLSLSKTEVSQSVCYKFCQRADSTYIEFVVCNTVGGNAGRKYSETCWENINNGELTGEIERIWNFAISRGLTVVKRNLPSRILLDFCRHCHAIVLRLRVLSVEHKFNANAIDANPLQFLLESAANLLTDCLTVCLLGTSSLYRYVSR